MITGLRNRNLSLVSLNVPATGIVCFGDSITEGLGLTTPSTQRWSKLLANALGLIEYSYGISGTLLQRNLPVEGTNGEQRYLATLRQNGPHQYLVIMYGLNDLRHPSGAVSAKNFILQYSQIIDGCLRYGYRKERICLGSPPYVDPSIYPNGAYNAGTVAKHMAYRDAVNYVATKYGLKYVDIYEAMKTHSDPLSLLQADLIHPNATGHIFIKDQFLTVLP